MFMRGLAGGWLVKSANELTMSAQWAEIVQRAYQNTLGFNLVHAWVGWTKDYVYYHLRWPLYAMSCYTVADTAITFVDYVMFGPCLMFNAICYSDVVCLSVCRCRSLIITVALLWWFSPWFDTEDVDPDRENDFVGGLVLPNFFFYFIPKNATFLTQRDWNS